MLRRDAYITLINELQNGLTDYNRGTTQRLLRRAVQQFDLLINEADGILNASGLVIGEQVDYFEVLDLSISGFENRSESDLQIALRQHTKTCIVLR